MNSKLNLIEHVSLLFIAESMLRKNLPSSFLFQDNSQVSATIIS